MGRYECMNDEVSHDIIVDGAGSSILIFVFFQRLLLVGEILFESYYNWGNGARS